MEETKKISKRVESKWFKRYLIIIPILLLIIGTFTFSQVFDLGFFGELFSQQKIENINPSSLEDHGAYYDDIEGDYGTHTLIIYSNIRSTYEDNQWKRIENARSLKGSGIKFGTIKEDKKYGYEIIDFNYTSIVFQPIIQEAEELNKNVPLKMNGKEKVKFNYNSLSQRQQVTFYGDVLHSNFSVGGTSTVFTVNESGGNIGALQGWIRDSGLAFTAFPATSFGNLYGGEDLHRAGLNFSLAQLPPSATVIRANISMWAQIDPPTLKSNFTFVGKNGTFDVFNVNSPRNFTGWLSSGPYGGPNLTMVMNSSIVQPGHRFNISISEDGNTILKQQAGKDLKIMLLAESDVLNITGPNLGEAESINFGTGFAQDPILFIEYLLTNNVPSFNSGYPQLNSTDGQNSTDKNLIAHWIATDLDNDIIATNITWFTNNQTNFTLNLSQSISNIFYTSTLDYRNLSYGQTWIAMISLFDGINVTRVNTSELLIMNKRPSVPNINLPIDNLLTANYTINMSCYGSTDFEDDPISYEFYLEREINPPTIAYGNLSITSNVTNLGLDGKYYWRCQANDNSSQSGFNSTRSFLVDRRLITGYDNTFSSTVFSGTNQTFTVNVTMNLTVAKDVNATLMNNTLILNTYKEKLDTNKFRFTTSRIIPNNDTQYFWNFTILLNNNTIVYNTSHSFVQTVSIQSIYDCTDTFTNSSSMLLMNYSIKNEENETVLRGDWEGSFIRYFDDIALNSSFTFGLKSNITNVKICSSPANTSFKISGTIRYQGLDPGTGTRLQDPRNYLFYKDNAGNSTGVLDIPLYLLDYARANEVKFTLVDTSDVGIQNGIIKIQRYNPGNNTYKTVAMGKTDQNGDTVIYLRLNDVTHRLIVTLPSGETKDYGDVVFSGSTYKITTTSVSPISKLFDFDYVTNSITFENSTKTFSASYEDTNPNPSNRISSGCFAVTRLTLNQTDNVVYNRCTLNSYGTFSVYVGNGSYQYQALLYANRNPSSLIIKQIYVDLTSHILGNNLGKEGVVFTLLIVLSLVMLSLWKPEIAVAMSLLGIIISVMFGFFMMTYATLVAFIIAGAMFIYRISKR